MVLDNGIKVPSYKRPFGIMFQDPILFEHLNIKQNLDFADRRSKPKVGTQKIISKNELINHLDLLPLLDRHPQNLSGGEKLRVALARTILTKSEYLFFDEPMSDIDIKYKAKLLIFLKMINKKFNIPILYITHSIEEISQIADNLILINNGKKIDYGPAQDILNNNSFQNLIGKFESSSVLEGLLKSSNKPFNMTTLDINGQRLIVPGKPRLENNKVRVRIRSRDVIVSPVKLDFFIVENELEGVVSKIETETNTAFTELVITLINKKSEKKFQTLRARITTYNFQKMKLRMNSKVFAYISSVSIDRQAY